MNRIASLFLIAALFYNVLGLYMLVAEQDQQVWVTATETTDDLNFEIIESDIDPYAYVLDSGFENVNEDIFIKNNSYHVFKKRIQNNVLKLYCLKYPNNSVLSNNIKKIVDSQLFDTNTDKQNSGKKLIKSFSKDFISQILYSLSSTTFVVFPVLVFTYSPKSTLLSGYLTINYPPPNRV